MMLTVMIVTMMIFQVASMIMNAGLWFMKHAAMLAARPEPAMEEAKEVHTCLRKAAGLVKFVQDSLVPQLSEICGADSPLMLVVNKMDLLPHAVREADVEDVDAVEMVVVDAAIDANGNRVNPQRVRKKPGQRAASAPPATPCPRACAPPRAASRPRARDSRAA